MNAPMNPMTPMVEQQIRMFNHITSKMGNLMFELYYRWLDEGGYEDFKKYETAMKRNLESIGGVKFVKAQKRPFGFKYEFSGKNSLLFVKSRGNGKYSLSLQM